ncbi:transposase [Streptomyces sp. NPDC001759]
MTDSQSVKADAVVGTDSRGFDGGKSINGRKRHVVVDTLGLLLSVMVTAAETCDRIAGQVLLGQVADVPHRLELVWADDGYNDTLPRPLPGRTGRLPEDSAVRDRRQPRCRLLQGVGGGGDPGEDIDEVTTGSPGLAVRTASLDGRPTRCPEARA